MESAEQTFSRSETVERLHEQLQKSLHERVTSEDWQQALTVAARFHDYSFWAQSLVRGITPSQVAGYRTWQQLGRQVRRGERGLQILAQWSARRSGGAAGEAESGAVKDWRYVGRGWDNPGDEWLAHTAAAEEGEARKLAREARLVGQAKRDR